MTQLNINVGAAPNDASGDPIRDAGVKINANFTELYAANAALGNIKAKNIGTSVADPGTGKLEMLLPIQTLTAASKVFATADLFMETRRSNAGSAMTDTFPASTATGLVNGTKIVVVNFDATASDTITAGAGTTISGTGVVGPGRAIQYVYDAPNTIWRPTLNTGTALLGPNNLSDLGSVPTARTNLGLVIGTDVQAHSANLDSLAGYTVDTDGTLAANSATRIPSQSAVKSYNDNLLTGLKWKPSVQAATTPALGNITLSGEQTIDAVLTSASRVLVKNQSTASQNGIYLSASGAWSRVADMDAGAEFPSATVFVESGTVNGDTQWTCTNNTVTVGSTSVVFAQVSGAGTYSAGAGLSLSGNQFSVDSTTAAAFTATKLATARNIDGQPFDGSAAITVIAPGTHAATSKATPVDADELPLVDSAAANVLKRLTWANLKATIKTYIEAVASLNLSGTLGLTQAYATGPQIDYSGQASNTLVNNGTVTICASTLNGKILITEFGGVGDTAEYMFTGVGSIVLIASVVGFFVAPTSSPAAGKASIYMSGGNIILVNKSGVTITYRLALTKC